MRLAERLKKGQNRDMPEGRKRLLKEILNAFILKTELTQKLKHS